jgi:hypothetical protein
MSRDEIKKQVMKYINNNLNSEYLEDRIDIILRLLYDIEEYLDYENETIDKVIDLLQNEKIFH